jgi:hypothetical protein
MNEDRFVVTAILYDGGIEDFVEYGNEEMVTRVEELVSQGYAADGISIYKLIPYDEEILVSVLVNKRPVE